MRLKALYFLCLVLFISCKKTTLSPKIEKVESPATETIRGVILLNQQLTFVGGNRGGKGFLMYSKPDMLAFNINKIDFPYPLFGLCNAGNRYVLVDEQGGIWYTYDFTSYFQHYRKEENFVPDLYQKPGRELFALEDGEVTIVGGGDYEYGSIQTTRDKFESWKSVLVGNELRTLAIHFDGTGWAGGFGILLYTDDWGSNWTRRDFGQLFISNIAFNEEGIAAMAGFNGQFYYNTNGNDWEKAKVEGKNIFVNKIVFLTKDIAVAVGNHGTYCLSEDMGKSWKCDKSFGDADVFDVIRFGIDQFIAVGEDGAIWKVKI